MKKNNRYIRDWILGTLMGIAIFAGIPQLEACTSAIVRAEKGADGRWLLWKHRDSGHPDNYVRRIEGTDSTFSYVALFNAADTASREAWIGFNEAGFAVMNTATYNIPAPEKNWQDREGLIMSQALAICRTLDDFRRLLMEYPGKRGVQANFGAIDAKGNGAYFETCDDWVKEFPLDSLTGINSRTNYSLTQHRGLYKGLERHISELSQLDSLLTMDRPWAPAGMLGAEDFLEVLSRSFLLPQGKLSRPSPATPHPPMLNLLDGEQATAPDEGKVISRHSSCASVVIEGPLPGEDPAKGIIMWISIGFPALSEVEAVTLDSIPDGLLPSPATGRSSLCDSVNSRRDKAFLPPSRKNRPRAFNLPYLRREVPFRQASSLLRYTPARKRRTISSPMKLQ